MIRPRCTSIAPPQHAIRRYATTIGQEPFAPLSPELLGKPQPARQYRRTIKWGRRLLYLALGTGVVWGIDRQMYASALARSARTFWLGLVVATDYKINFRPNPPFAASIEALHMRNAERLFELLRTNGGLYLKIGQAVAMQSAVLPPEFQKMFSRMFDDAPQNDWNDVRQVIQEDFGKSVEEVFGVSFDGDPAKGVMEQTARASASVAQVHWARLGDGREVAIKIQKREIAAQVGWDLWTFKVVARIQGWLFDLPFYTLVPYITERLMLETDFENEAANSERMAALVAGEPRLRGRVYIPRIDHALSSRRVMTAEWIEGVRLWDKDAITRRWRGPRGQGSPGCRGAPLDGPGEARIAPSNVDHAGHAILKPERSGWKGAGGTGGLGLGLPDVMQTMVDLFSAQMFLWGWVHCDPHPGNIFIRRQPSGASELVLIDHGLYIHMDPTFRHQYARFWKALLTFDNATLAAVVQSWGVTNAEIFASATLLRPYTGGDRSLEREIGQLSKADKQERAFAMQQRMRQGLREILGDEKKWPRELIFLGRNLRIVQANNQRLGSPINRVKITGLWASRALVEDPNLRWSQRLANWGRHVLFRMVLLGSDVLFYGAAIKQYFGFGGGLEDELEQQMRGMAKDMGVELQHSLFDG